MPNTTIDRKRCKECIGNYVEEAGSDICDTCAFAASQPPHTGHYSRLGGTYWCDTCNSPYCELA